MAVYIYLHKEPPRGTGLKAFPASKKIHIYLALMSVTLFTNRVSGDVIKLSEVTLG